MDRDKKEYLKPMIKQHEPIRFETWVSGAPFYQDCTDEDGNPAFCGMF